MGEIFVRAFSEELAKLAQINVQPTGNAAGGAVRGISGLVPIPNKINMGMRRPGMMGTAPPAPSAPGAAPVMPS
jgi:hypothetical protein